MSDSGFYAESGEEDGDMVNVSYIGKGKQTLDDRMADIRNYYSGEAGGKMKGDALDNQVEASIDAYSLLEAQKAKQYSILENNSKFGGVDFMQEFKVKKYEESTIGKIESEEIPGAGKGVIQSNEASNIVGKKVDVNQEPLLNVDIPEYAEKRKNDLTQNLNTFTNLANNTTYGKDKTGLAKNTENELLKKEDYQGRGDQRALKKQGDTYFINQALGKENSEVLWAKGGSRLLGFDYTDDVYQTNKIEPSKFNNQAVTKIEVDSLMENFDAETVEYEDIMSQINLMEESFPEMNLRGSNKLNSDLVQIRDDGTPMPKNFIDSYYKLIEKRDAYRKKYYGRSMPTRYNEAGKSGILASQNLYSQLKQAWDYFNITIPKSINKKKERVNSFIEKQGKIQEKRSN